MECSGIHDESCYSHYFAPYFSEPSRLLADHQKVGLRSKSWMITEPLIDISVPFVIDDAYSSIISGPDVRLVVDMEFRGIFGGMLAIMQVAFYR